MDPQTAWNEMLEAISQRDWDRAFELAEGLRDWMAKGGFPPQTAGLAVRRGWNRSMAEFGCLLAFQMVRNARKRRNRKD